MSKRVLVVSEHDSRRYSGGRYHSWMMSEALAAGGADVTVWTNVEPLLKRDFLDFPAHDQVTLHIDPHFQKAPAGHFDAIFLVPGMRLDWSVFSAAVGASRRYKAPLVFLDFEAPGWYNAENERKRPFIRTLPWWLSARYADIILSTTAYGSSKAQDYYLPAGSDRAFRHCYCAINSFAADLARGEKRNQIVCITRLDRATPHKGAADLLSLMCGEFRDYRLLVIGSLPEDIKQRLTEAAAAHDMTFANRTGLTDLEKFEEIKSSRLMVFLSRFEGFGYPPVEALYCGTPCIARPLPVLQEVNEEHLHYLHGHDSLKALAVRVLAGDRDEESTPGRIRAAEVGRFENYVKRLQTLMSDLPPFPAAQRKRTGMSIAVMRTASLASYLR